MGIAPDLDHKCRIQILLEAEFSSDCMALHCTGSFIIILALSQYDLNNVERDVKHQTIIRC